MNTILVPEPPKEAKAETATATPEKGGGKKRRSFARKTTPEPVRVYCYGALPPRDEEQRKLVNTQIWEARRYQNDLIAVELKRRERYRDLRSRLVPGMNEAEDRYKELKALKDQAVEEIKEYHAKHHTKKTPRALTENKKKRAEKAKEAYAKVKVFREKARQHKKLKQQAEELDLWAKDENKRLRNGSEAWGHVPWGTKQLSEMAVGNAKSSGKDPVFRSWNLEGALGVQLQHGASVDSLFSDNTYFQIDPVAPGTFDLPRSRRRRASRTKCRIRVGTKGIAPVWAEFGMIYHRPLPADGRITRVRIQRRRVGRLFRWFVLISVESKEFFTPPNRKGLGVAALDVGWRTHGPGEPVRYAFLVDDEGRRTDLRLPWDIFGRISYTEKLRSIQDHNFNKLKRDFAATLKQVEEEVPHWFVEAIRPLVRWKSPKRMHRLIGKWRWQRWDGDTGPWAIVEAWARQDRHLYQWERDQATRSLNWREEIYRNMADELTRRYSKIVIETLNVAKLRKRDEDNPMPQSAQHIGHYVAIGTFLTALKHAALSSGCLIEGVDPAYTTTTCRECGSREGWDRKQLFHECSGCGAKWDQDENAAWNILASAGVTPTKRGPLEVTVVPEKKVKPRRERKENENENKPRTSLSEVLEQLSLSI